MHLGLNTGAAARQREQLLVDWLERVSSDAEAIFLLGDVFDFWFEYERVIPKGFTRLLGKLAELSDRGVEVHFFPGNHDMWTLGYLERECGVTIHHGTGIFELYGKRIFLAHGDNLGKRTCGERFLNGFFRSRTARWVVQRMIHPDLMLRFGHWWSRHSRKNNDRESYTFWGEDEPLVRFSREYVARIPVDYLIFGHLHHYVDYDLGDGRRVIFLGDWVNSPSYAALGPDGSLKLERV